MLTHQEGEKMTQRILPVEYCESGTILPAAELAAYIRCGIELDQCYVGTILLSWQRLGVGVYEKDGHKYLQKTLLSIGGGDQGEQ